MRPRFCSTSLQPPAGAKDEAASDQRQRRGVHTAGMCSCGRGFVSMNGRRLYPHMVRVGRGSTNEQVAGATDLCPAFTLLPDGKHAAAAVAINRCLRRRVAGFACATDKAYDRRRRCSEQGAARKRASRVPKGCQRVYYRACLAIPTQSYLRAFSRNPQKYARAQCCEKSPCA